MAEKTMHTCNPNKPGFPLPFGKKDSTGQCPRCAELTAGAEPRTLGWVENMHRRDEVGITSVDYREHRKTCDRCRTGAVCTFGDW
jgi:hypothetical protein